MPASAARFRLAFAPTHRVIDRVHRHPACLRTNTEPARAASLAPANVEEVGVADLSDRREAREVNLSCLARWQADRRKLAFFRHDLTCIAGGPSNLPAPTRATLP